MKQRLRKERKRRCGCLPSRPSSTRGSGSLKPNTYTHKQKGLSFMHKLFKTTMTVPSSLSLITPCEHLFLKNNLQRKVKMLALT